MAYTIKRTDGTTLLTLSDSRVDQLTTSLALIGKNVDSYGEYYNDNLVGLLENFASVNEPRSPLLGQLWYNKVDGRMYVYGIDSIFKPVAGAQISATQPAIANQGDLWIDSSNKQLWFTVDGTNFTLAGPQYSTITGKSGWVVETITDTAKNDQIVAALYNKDVLLGIAASNSFDFDVPVSGMTRVTPGFNLNQSIAGIRFVGTATSADSIQGFTPGDYMTKIGDQVLEGGLIVKSDSPGLLVGNLQDIALTVDSASANIIHTITDKPMHIKGVSSKNSLQAYFSALTIDAANIRLGVFKEDPSYPLDITGDTRITGDLYVQGNATYVESVNLRVTDKNIELAYGNVTGDIGADGGGITLHGTTDYTMNWVNNTTGWNFNTNTNLTSADSTYQINGSSVLGATSLGSVITDAPGMRRMGVLDSLTVTNVVIHGSTVEGTGTDITLYLSGSGSGTVDVTGDRITSVARPVAPDDAATKLYVDDAILLVGSKGFTVSIDTTGMIDPDTEIITYLDNLLPIYNPSPYEYLNLAEGTRVRVLGSSMSLSVLDSPPQLVNFDTTAIQVRDISNNIQSVIAQSGLAGTIPASTIITPTITRVVRQYFVVSILGTLVWQFDGVIA